MSIGRLNDCEAYSRVMNIRQLNKLGMLFVVTPSTDLQSVAKSRNDKKYNNKLNVRSEKFNCKRRRSTATERNTTDSRDKSVLCG